MTERSAMRRFRYPIIFTTIKILCFKMILSLTFLFLTSLRFCFKNFLSRILRCVKVFFLFLNIHLMPTFYTNSFVSCILNKRNRKKVYSHAAATFTKSLIALNASKYIKWWKFFCLLAIFMLPHVKHEIQPRLVKDLSQV